MGFSFLDERGPPQAAGFALRFPHRRGCIVGREAALLGLAQQGLVLEVVPPAQVFGAVVHRLGRVGRRQHHVDAGQQPAQPGGKAAVCIGQLVEPQPGAVARVQQLRELCGQLAGVAAGA